MSYTQQRDLEFLAKISFSRPVSFFGRRLDICQVTWLGISASTKCYFDTPMSPSALKANDTSFPVVLYTWCHDARIDEINEAFRSVASELRTN